MRESYFEWNFKGFLWNSPQKILPMHWNIQFIYAVEILRAFVSKNSYTFWKCHTDLFCAYDMTFACKAKFPVLLADESKSLSSGEDASYGLYLQGLYSLSGKTSYGKISWSLETAIFGFRLFRSLWNLTGTSAAALPRCLTNFRALRLL